MPSSGIDDFRGTGYQIYVAIEYFLYEFKNPDLISIILESPKNKIEDTHIIYKNRIILIQTKKKDQGYWIKSELKKILLKFYSMYRDPKPAIRSLNINDFLNYKLQFHFITNGDFSPKLHQFSLALDKFHLNELLDEDDKQNLKMFDFNIDEDKFYLFLKELRLKKTHHASSNRDDMCETIKKICTTKLCEISSLKVRDSNEIISRLYEICATKSSGNTVFARTLKKKDLQELIAEKKNLKTDFFRGNENLKILREILIEIIPFIENKIDYNIELKDENLDYTYLISFIFTLNIDNKKGKFYVILLPEKITQYKINEMSFLEDFIIKKKKGIPMFISTNRITINYALNNKYYLQLDHKEIQEFIKNELKGI